MLKYVCIYICNVCDTSILNMHVDPKHAHTCRSYTCTQHHAHAHNSLAIGSHGGSWGWLSNPNRATRACFSRPFSNGRRGWVMMRRRARAREREEEKRERVYWERSSITGRRRRRKVVGGEPAQTRSRLDIGSASRSVAGVSICGRLRLPPDCESGQDDALCAKNIILEVCSLLFSETENSFY